jgi:hypothetical protein
VKYYFTFPISRQIGSWPKRIVKSPFNETAFFSLALFVLLLNCPRPQADTTEPKVLPNGVLVGLVRAQELYCEDQFGNKHEKGCDKKFASHLQWSEVVIAPAAETAILVENQNQGLCGLAGCALYRFVQKADGSYAQVLGKQCDVGTLKRFAVLKEITKPF